MVEKILKQSNICLLIDHITIIYLVKKLNQFFNKKNEQTGNV